MERRGGTCFGTHGKIEEMTFYLVLKLIFGMALLGSYDTEQECKQAAVEYMTMLVAQRSDKRKEHNATLMCVGYAPPPRLLSREFSDA